VVIVSQPQHASLAIAVKALKAFQSLKVRVLGVIENMSTFVCGTCGTEHSLFSHGGAKVAAQGLEVPFLGEIPLSIDVCAASDAGVPLVALMSQSPQAIAFTRIAELLAAQVSIATLRQRTAIPLRPV
jgi:ATP-binding protein involved in chromosome partitioning